MTAYHDELKEAFLERFEGIANEDDERNEDWEPPRYWQDDISAIADASIPIHTDEMYEIWMELGRPDVDDAGGIEGVTDIDRIVAWALYEYATAYLYELAEWYDLR